MPNEETNEELFTKILGSRMLAENVCSVLSGSVTIPSAEKLQEKFYTITNNAEIDNNEG